MLEVDVHQDGSAVVVRPAGELDLASARVLSVPLAAAAAHGATRVVLDLRGLTFIDSSGIGLIIRFQRHYAAEGIAFGLVRGDERVQRPFSIAHVEPLLPWVGPPSERRHAAPSPPEVSPRRGSSVATSARRRPDGAASS